MAEQDAIFGGEHSSHYYFREFWRADTGMLAALGGQPRPLSEFAAAYVRYVAFGKIKTKVADVPAKLDRSRPRGNDPASSPTGSTDSRSTSATAAGQLPPSNTEPLLRLNVEAPTKHAMAQLRDEALALVR